MDKKSLSERDICSKYIAPSIQKASWSMHKQVREEVSFSKGHIIVRGKLHSRGESRHADFILYHQAKLPIAAIEAKDSKHSHGYGMQQTTRNQVSITKQALSFIALPPLPEQPHSRQTR
jgi:type I restriction enzyme R subunit